MRCWSKKLMRVTVLAMCCGAGFSGVAAAGITALPGYEEFEEVSRISRTLGSEGRVSSIAWSGDGSAVEYTAGGAHFSFDLQQRVLKQVEQRSLKPDSSAQRSRWLRGRQRDQEPSPCGSWVAKCVDWNVHIEPVDGGEPITVTADGTRKHRYGKASWVYGEELRQNSAMWWSPCSGMLAFYELDEAEVPDYYLTGSLTQVRSTLMQEGYPKAGEPNPIARLWVYHMGSGSKVAIDVGEDTEQYIYNISWQPSDKPQLIFSRLNRRQDTLEVLAADPQTGQARVVVTEQQATFQDNWPTMLFLEDGQRFIWASERTGWQQFQLRHLDGQLVNELTRGEYVASSIVRVIEEADGGSGVVFYTAYSDDNPLNLQVHRVNLDGTEQVRLTRDGLNHTAVDVSPCGKWFVARSEAVNVPPTTRLYDGDGEVVAVLAEPDQQRIDELGWHEPELFTFKADDGEKDLYGVLYKPRDFDPKGTYPLLVSVYGGPLSQTVRNAWRPAEPLCEFGFLVASVDNRGTANRGKAFKDAAYLKLGIVDVKDQADAVVYLTQRPYVDGNRVGIYGTSYGGYLAALALMRYPDLFQVAVASAAVTDWRNYDTIYTERFMRKPEENLENYDAGSVLSHVTQLRGRLLILHGMVDDNVHPSNAFQLIDALHEAGKDFDLMLYPNRGHGLGIHARNLRIGYFVQHLLDGFEAGAGNELVREGSEQKDAAAIQQ